jgi:hypothetical protein
MGSLIRLVAILASGLVLFGFAYFATDEMSRGSQTQQAELERQLEGSAADPAPIAPTPGQEADRERVNGPVREFVEDANDLLLGPFTGVVDGSEDRWVTHGVPALLALLLYGLGLGMLANMLPKEREHGDDWRLAA